MNYKDSDNIEKFTISVLGEGRGTKFEGARSQLIDQIIETSEFLDELLDKIITGDVEIDNWEKYTLNFLASKLINKEDLDFLKNKYKISNDDLIKKVNWHFLGVDINSHGLINDIETLLQSGRINKPVALFIQEFGIANLTKRELKKVLYIDTPDFTGIWTQIEEIVNLNRFSGKLTKAQCPFTGQLVQVRVICPARQLVKGLLVKYAAANILAKKSQLSLETLKQISISTKKGGFGDGRLKQILKFAFNFPALQSI